MKALTASLALAAALGGVAPLAALAVPTIVPPPGWTAKQLDVSAGDTSLLGVWNAPDAHDGFTETINLAADTSGSVGFDAYVTASRAQLLKALTSALIADADEPCGAGTAHRFEYTSVFGTHTLTLTQLVRISDGRAYVASYGRLSTAKPDPAALAALLSLCQDAPAGPGSGRG